jgi:hypothetical protein
LSVLPSSNPITPSQKKETERKYAVSVVSAFRNGVKQMIFVEFTPL